MSKTRTFSPAASSSLLKEVTSSRKCLKASIHALVRKLRDHGEPSRGSVKAFEAEMDCLQRAYRELASLDDLEREKRDLADERFLRARRHQVTLEQSLGLAK